MGDRVLTEQEKDALTTMVKGLDASELEVIVKKIPVEWLIYGTQCQVSEMQGKLTRMEQIFMGRVN